ncbi:MAG: type II toxin-antitoxin system VapC family toxin [Blastocatellia bacterium]
MIWFVDTSALIKRYLRETGSKWLREEIVHHRVLISQLTPIEVLASIGRRRQQGTLSPFAFLQARRIFINHINDPQYQILNVSSAIVNEAMRLTFRQSLRAYDAVQLATALKTLATQGYKQLVFLTADAQLERVARAEGLQTDNPLDH